MSIRLVSVSTVFVLAIIFATPARAQVCALKHPTLTALDHESMVAAYTASFRGLKGRAPTWLSGSGADDGNYWIAVSDHYGEYSDGVCRAGWNAYMELKLGGSDSVSPALGDQPARFQPTAPGQTLGEPAPSHPLPIPPLHTIDFCAAQITMLQTAMTARLDQLVRHVDLVDQNVTAGRAENTTFFAAVTRHWKAIVGTVGTAAIGFIGGKKLG